MSGRMYVSVSSAVKSGLGQWALLGGARHPNGIMSGGQVAGNIEGQASKSGSGCSGRGTIQASWGRLGDAWGRLGATLGWTSGGQMPQQVPVVNWYLSALQTMYLPAHALGIDASQFGVR
ncbi:hypothetical protein E5D57_011538 [Metarhizium anisopliae]|nr:hypothetical protein E5D57_011538 [Metarhizium anisopliae]